MKLFRYFGTFLIFISTLTASAEAVVAFNSEDSDYQSLFVSEIWEIIIGSEFNPGGIVESITSVPAWVFFGSLGVIMIFISRLKKNRNEVVSNKFNPNF